MIDGKTKQRLIEKYGYDGLFAVSKNEEADTSGSDISTSDLGPSLVDSLMSHNWSRIGEKYFNLPSATEILNEMKGIKHA